MREIAQMAFVLAEWRYESAMQSQQKCKTYRGFLGMA